VRRHGLNAKEHTLQIDIEDQIPILVGRREERSISSDAGIVDQNIYALVLFDDLGHKRLNLVAVGHIDRKTHCPAACGLDLYDGRLDRARILIGDNGASPLTREAIRDRFADP
jgi:hypothetical protein